jgi:hypothetical protein
MLKIVNRIPAIPLIPETVKEPIRNPWQTQVYAMLRPWHPLFKFSVVHEDDAGQFAFRIELQNISANTRSTCDEFKSAVMLGLFPWAVFTDPDQRQQAFEEYLFSVLQGFIFEVLSYREMKALKSFPLMSSGSVNWPMVTEYLKMATNSLSPWFDRATSIQNGRLHFVLSQTRTGWFANGTTRCQSFDPVDLAGFPVAEIEAECAEAGSKAETMLKQYLKDRITNALYAIRFKI